jgi:polyhydroxyalkanoate synthesis repressor PhaR
MINTKDSDIRIIKKYPNRRLYDETDSRYINFSDLHKMILEGKEFKVVVDKTNEDQTLKLMLQIFLDLELSGQHLFSDQSLKSLIVLSNSPARQFIDLYLKNLLSLRG